MRAAALPLFICALGVCAQEVVQPQDPTLQFEVAAIKPFVIDPGRPLYLGGPTSPNRVDYRAATLRYLIATAYGMKEYQVIGPRWLDSERYEVTAELPEGKTRVQANLMLQNLLAERFGLRMHRELKEMEVYELRIGKGGPKLKESGPAVRVPEPDHPQESRTFQPMKRDRDEFVILPEGRPGLVVLMNADRSRQMSSRMQTMTSFAKFLEQVGRAVLDKTGLTGTYDIHMEYSGGRPNFSGTASGEETPAGVPLIIPGPGVAIGLGGGPTSAADPDAAPGLVTAVQQLGLNLVPGKAPIAAFVVDQANKTPKTN
jgi:uncharacterized protein (TIGR03435 family)